MRNVKGFLSDDGMFFDAKEDAELYEATRTLEGVVSNIGANPEKFMIVVNGCRQQLRRYLDAQDAYEKSEARSWEGSEEKPPAAHNPDDGGSETTAPVLEQPVDKSEPVPDVGSGVSAETVSNGKSVDGTGGGRAHARSVRSASYLATTSSAAIAAACGSGS